jgi:hypothetical protein
MKEIPERITNNSEQVEPKAAIKTCVYDVGEKQGYK